MNMLLESSRMGITAECYQHPAVTNHNSPMEAVMLNANVTAIPIPVTTKTCTSCNIEKPFSEFTTRKEGKFGLASRCKPCYNAYAHKQRKANPERTKANADRYLARRTPEQKELGELRKVRHTMIDRCYNPQSTGYKYYGGRGITVCQRWLDSSDDFVNDMWPRPEGYQIDRIDNDAGYSPDNCRWATRSENIQNRRVPSNNTSGVTGVCLRRDRYQAHINRNGIFHTKTFTDFFEACCWRKSREINFRGNTA